MTYIIIKCPHCGTFIRQTTKGQYNWGSPLKMCYKCNTAYIDSCYHEVAIEGFSNTDTIRSDWWLMLLPIMITFMSSFAYPILFLLVVGMIVAMIFGVVRTRKKNEREMKAEMARSIERLSNYDYALLLKKAGYDVPDKYLKKG